MEFATPQRSGKDALISAAEKQSMLDNLDLEGTQSISLQHSLVTDPGGSRGSNKVFLVKPG